MTDVRTVAKAAYEDKLTKCDDFRHSDFVPKKEEVDNIYLTPEQIQEMLDLDHFHQGSRAKRDWNHWISARTRNWYNFPNAGLPT